MYYRLNESHTFKPRSPGNVASVDRVTDYLAGGKVASESELRSILTGIDNPHGCIVKWLARRSRRVLIPASGIIAEAATSPVSHPTVREPKPLSEKAVTVTEGVWTNPNSVDLTSPLIYRIEIESEDGNLYDYIGKARNVSRMREYDRNMRKIREGRERGKTQGYRAVHYALYQALDKDWPIKCCPLENCSSEQLNVREAHLIGQYPCNLNDGKSWRVADMASITLESLLRR
tara:strand:- start:480 stop:1175 length:696 start_codon:yes stop_codon:yes gene_type:complete